MEFCDECGSLKSDGECLSCTSGEEHPSKSDSNSGSSGNECPRCGTTMFRDVKDSAESDRPGSRKHGSQPVSVGRKCPECGYGG